MFVFELCGFHMHIFPFIVAGIFLFPIPCWFFVINRQVWVLARTLFSGQNHTFVKIAACVGHIVFSLSWVVWC